MLCRLGACDACDLGATQSPPFIPPHRPKNISPGGGTFPPRGSRSVHRICWSDLEHLLCLIYAFQFWHDFWYDLVFLEINLGLKNIQKSRYVSTPLRMFLLSCLAYMLLHFGMVSETLSNENGFR